MISLYFIFQRLTQATVPCVNSMNSKDFDHI